jgi:hypothetical protein
MQQRALKGELPEGATLEDIQSWRQRETHPAHYQLEYRYAKKGNQSRKIYTTPKGHFNPWRTVNERIVTGETIFIIDHAEKRVNVFEGPGIFEIDRGTLFAPADFLYPLALIEDIRDVQISPLDERQVMIRWSNDRGQEGRLKSVQAILDTERGLPTRVMLTYYSLDNDHSKDSNHSVWLAELSDYPSVAETPFPQSWKLTKRVQYNEPKMAETYGEAQLQAFRESRRDWMLSMDFDFTIERFDEYEPLPYREQYILKAEPQDVAVLAADADYFWHEAQEGYFYADHRLRYLEQVNQYYAGTLKDEAALALVTGTGPHVFER